MKLKELLGNDYVDGMTLEDVDKALEKRNLIDKAYFDNVSSELAAKNRESKETSKTIAQLESDNLKTKEELEAATKKANDIVKQFTIKANRLEVEKRFAIDGGLKPDEYKDVIDMVVDEDAEVSLKRADNLISLIKSKVSSGIAAAESNRLDKNPKINSTPAGETSKTAFEEMSITEKMQFKANNPELYSQMKK